MNYTPTRGWFHHWLDFDLDEIRADLDSIADLGVDHVRVFPLWPLLQPNRTLIRTAAIEDVVAVVDAAAERGLDTSVDVLQGHLSSFDFLPAWVVSWHQRNIFTDPEVIEAQERLIRELGEAHRDQQGFLGLTVGNETNQFAHSYHPERHPETAADSDVWLGRMLRAARVGAPAAMHCHSFDDAVWFQDDSPVTPEQAVRHGDLTTAHSWVFTGVSRAYPAGHPAYRWFARYLVEVAQAWSTRPDRDVWLQEVGAPYGHVPVERVGDFVEQTLAGLAAAPRLWGVTWWCSHDVDSSLADFPDVEYGLGLLTNNRRKKPAAAALQRVLPRLRDQAGAQGSRGRVAIVAGASPDGVVAPSSMAPGSAVFDAWVDLAEQGEVPAVVLEPNVGNQDLLRLRGIERFERVDAV